MPVLRDYVTVLSRVGSETHPGFYNQSHAAFVIRELLALNMPGNELRGALAQKLLVAVMIGGVLLLTYFAGDDRDQRVRLFALLTAVMTIASPLVWYHHNVFLMLSLVVLLAASPDQAGYFRAGAVAYLLIQSERLVEKYAVALLHGSAVPEAHIMAGLPVLIGQGLLIAVLSATAMRVAIYQKRTLVTGGPDPNGLL